jgi:lipopolysaccharide/colanic/teichoic acid biosynthesis glycosyltransferase
MLDRLIALLLIVLLSPLVAFLSLLLWLTEGWPIFYIQKRIGKAGKIFEMIKFRTMKKGSEGEQEKYRNLNEADGPVFKIRNDPRFTKMGIFLSHTGMDELPQLINVVKGEMAIVGPRPLPVKEEEKIDQKCKEIRRTVKPGLVSPWVVDGYHGMKFSDWMKSDQEYIKKKNFFYDVGLLSRSVGLVIRLILRESFHWGINSKRTAELAAK